MESSLPKLATAALMVIAAALLVIAYKLTQPPAEPVEEKVIYIDAASGKVYEQKKTRPPDTEPTENRLRREHPGGRTY